MKMKILASTLSSIVLISSAAIAHGDDSIDEIRFRQAGYAFMSWNMGKIKAQVIDSSVAYDQKQVEAAANVIAAIANSGMGALYPKGSDNGIGFHETRLKAEFFDNLQEVGKIARDFNGKANNLAAVAKSGNKGNIKTAFGELGETCKACHKKFREDD